MHRIYIVDNGLDKLSGHHYNQAIGLLHGAKELGYEATVFSSTRAAAVPEICALSKPSFEKALYRLDPFKQIDDYARMFFNELNSTLPNLDQTDVVLLPNANYDEICAIGMLVQQRQLTQRIIVRLLFYPHQHEADYFACLASLRSCPNVHLVTSSLPYSRWLSDAGFANQFIGGPPHVLPYARARQYTPQYEFAYLGQAAKVKGFEHIVNALILGAQQGYTPKTLIHSKNYTFDANLLAALPHVTVIPDAVSDEVFYEHVFSTKCIFAYYDPASYQVQDSAIVTEALALERYVLGSPLPFIRQTFGEDFFEFACTPNAWDPQALLHKMRLISAQTYKPASLQAASSQAKLLSCPTLFLAKMLA